MPQFHELIATPRAAKRFVNVYRLLEARAPDDAATAFEGNDSGGEHRAAIFLLAMLIGLPSEATELMRALVEQAGPAHWSAWLTEFFGRHDKRAAARSARRDRLLDLQGKLAAIQGRLTAQQLVLPPTTTFAFWAPFVARFSFQAGRLSATFDDGPGPGPTVAANQRSKRDEPTKPRPSS